MCLFLFALQNETLEKAETNSRERRIVVVPWKSSVAVDMVRAEGRDGGD